MWFWTLWDLEGDFANIWPHLRAAIQRKRTWPPVHSKPITRGLAARSSASPDICVLSWLFQALLSGLFCRGDVFWGNFFTDGSGHWADQQSCSSFKARSRHTCIYIYIVCVCVALLHVLRRLGQRPPEDAFLLEFLRPPPFPHVRSLLPCCPCVFVFSG